MLLVTGVLSLAGCHADYCGLADDLPEDCAASLVHTDVGECRDQMTEHCTIDESLALVSYVECIDLQISEGATCDGDGLFDTLMSCVSELKPVDPTCVSAIF